MNYILEAFGVGLYAHIIYMLCNPLHSYPFYVILIIVGFLKHYLASILQFHTLYCKNGNACESYHYSKENDKNIIRNSCYESLLFLLCGTLLSYFIPKSFVFFILGFSLHIIFEITNLHRQWCNENCY
jgi:hypothetical protein